MATSRRLDPRAAASDDPLMPSRSHGSATMWDHLRTLVRHRWWALLGALLLSVPMAAITLTMTPVFRATARVLVSDEPDQRVGLGTTNEQRPQSSTMEPRTQMEVVQSRTLALEVVQALKLWESPEYALAAQGAADDTARARAVVDQFRGNLSVAVVTDSRLLAISVESQDPALAAAAANAVAKRYSERDRESRLTTAVSSADFLTERLADQRRQVEASETALQNYRATRDALGLSDRQNIVGQKLADLNGAVTKAKTDRITRETQYRQIEAIRSDPRALEANPLVAANTYVQQLRAQAADLTRQDAQLAETFGPKHPDRVQVAAALSSVQARLQAEIAKVVEGIEADYRSAVVQENSLTGALNAQKAEAFSLDRKGVEYAALEREAVSARQVFDALLQQAKEATLSSEVQQSTVRLVDEADEPGAPIRPNKVQGLAAAVLLAVVGGFGGAFGREYARRVIASPTDVENRLKLPVLSLIPLTQPEETTSMVALTPMVNEAFRRLRANVMMTGNSEENPGNVLVVTSAAPSEGKSFVAARLAVALAAVDQRVLLIDADLRRPRMHGMFDRQRSPGLADTLLGRRSVAEVLRPVEPSGLTLIPAGVPSPQAAELISMAVFRKMLEELRVDFDWIVVDSPPVMAVADAAVLAHDATGVLFVTCADQTSLEAAETALEELDAAGARILGAVLNKAPLTRESFYYARYYRSEYASYHAPVEEPERMPRPAARTL